MSALPVIALFLPAGARADAWVSAWLATAEAARTLVLAHGDVYAQPAHPLYAQVLEAPAASRASLRPVCVCCVPQRGLVRTLDESSWRFARGGRRAYERVLLLSNAAEPTAVLRTLLDDARIAAKYALARCLVALREGPPGAAVEDGLLRRLELADALLVDADARPAWQAWLAQAGVPPPVCSELASALALPVPAPAALHALRERAHPGF
ncbi:GTP-binding protein [Verticiella sediminum]|uniref:GTP-binding protein n=1 Tax=Verticiella sediminum TaxID=1247510 RepID=A0A556AYH8_9BURK|nr:GTP-binding protein [Verticiella sediminum]TSH98000.1 GTP-binding protein [Verticiella sediminum]